MVTSVRIVRARWLRTGCNRIARETQRETADVGGVEPQSPERQSAPAVHRCHAYASVEARISLLGRLSIECEGIASPAAFSGRRSELVFAYLVAEHRRDVGRDELAEALWPQELPDAWAAALRGVVSDVRRVIALSMDGTLGTPRERKL